MTYNTHHGADRADRLDLAAIASTIEAARPDVVALQEVDRHWGPRSDDVDQPAWYAARLDLHVLFVAMMQQPLPDPAAPAREYGLALLSRWPLAHSHHLGYDRTGQGRAEPRGLAEATITVDEGSDARTVRVVNTHLSAHSAGLRRAEVSELLAHLDPTDEMPTVVVGDFNARPRSAPMRAIRARYADTWAAGPGAGRTVPGRRIDYIMTSRHLRAVQSSVIRSPASDHYPVIADLAWISI